MRALVISDTHFGAWTGDDLLRQPENLDRLGPHLDGIDELIFLGDLFDLFFSGIEDAFAAAEPFFDLLAVKLAGRRLVFVAGNHDHHLVVREREDLVELRLATGLEAEALEDELARRRFFRRFLERRLPEVETEVAYPTYTFGGVLCAHGHYLDAHVAGSVVNRLFTRFRWGVTAGEPEQPTVEDYEAAMTPVTELLFDVAQLPRGTRAQQNVYRQLQRLERALHAVATPERLVKGVVRDVAARAGALFGSSGAGPDAAAAAARERAESSGYEQARRDSAERAREQPLPEPEGPGFARVVLPSDPSGPALAAFAEVVDKLGWAPESGQLVFAHTHQPLAGACPDAERGLRFWNTGSWIYEPDLSSHQAYVTYLEQAWPGTGVLIDTDEPEPRLVEMLADRNPLVREGG